MVLPARTAVLNQLNKDNCLSVDEIMQKLQPDYGTEGQFTKDMFTEHCMALEANGMVEMAGYDLDDDGELNIQFRITDDGRHTVKKYVSKQYQ